MSSDARIERGDPRFDTIHAVWLAEKKPGYVTIQNGGMYRVLQPSDGVVIFVPVQGGVDGLYQTTSAKAIGGQK